MGRSISSGVKFEQIPNLDSKLVWASLLRMVFFLVFLLCSAERNRFSAWAVKSDSFSWLIQFLFAVSNGFMTNICFCYAPSLVENRVHLQQVASAILNFALSFGLLVGSFFSGPFLQFASGVWSTEVQLMATNPSSWGVPFATIYTSVGESTVPTARMKTFEITCTTVSLAPHEWTRGFWNAISTGHECW